MRPFWIHSLKEGTASVINRLSTATVTISSTRENPRSRAHRRALTRKDFDFIASTPSAGLATRIHALTQQPPFLETTQQLPLLPQEVVEVIVFDSLIV